MGAVVVLFTECWLNYCYFWYSINVIGYVHGTRESIYIRDILCNYKSSCELPLNACNGGTLQLPHLLSWMAGSGHDELTVEIICISMSLGPPFLEASKDDTRRFIYSPVWLSHSLYFADVLLGFDSFWLLELFARSSPELGWNLFVASFVSVELFLLFEFLFLSDRSLCSLCLIA